jgi:hypothetical protein
VSAVGRVRHNQSSVLRRLKGLLFMLISGLYSSCAVVDRFADHSVEYNLQAEAIKDQNLLNNIIRSAYRKPLQFTDLVAVTGQVSISGTGAFTVPFGGPRTGFIFSPSATTSDSPIFNLSVLNTKEFYQGILHPIDTQIIAFYLSERFPERVLLTLLISGIEVDNKSFSNDIGIYYDYDLKKYIANYSDFSRELESLIRKGLTVRPIGETKALGPPLSANDIRKMDIAKLDAQNIAIAPHSSSDKSGAPEEAMVWRRGVYYQLEKSDVAYPFCFKQTDSNPNDTCAEKKQEPVSRPGAKETQVANPRAKAGIYDLYLDGRKIALKVRSVEGIIYYLGEWAREEFLPSDEGPPTPPKLFNEYSRCRDATKEDVLFELKKGTTRSHAISTSYEGEEYYVDVDPSGCDRSSQVMELVLELLALNNSAKDLPSPSVLPVLTH